MSHLVDTMAFAGETPWHGLGNKIDADASIDEWIKASGLTWTAELAQVAAKMRGTDGQLHWHPADDYRIVYRSDTHKQFAVVSPQYKPLQPRDVLQFFAQIADKHKMKLETAGALKDGAIVWGLATNCREIVVKGNDKVKPYLLVSTSYDATQAHRWAFTTVRVVCNNTLRLSYSQDQEAVRVTHRTTVDPVDVQHRLGLLDEQTATFEVAANKLAEHKPTRAELDKLLTDLFGRKDESGQLTANSRNVIQEVQTSIVSSPGSNFDSSRGTAWGVLNGITHYVDHAARARSQDNRLASAWFGNGDKLKGNAMSALLEMAVNKTHDGLLGKVLDQTMAA